MNAVHDAQNDTVRSPFYAAALKTKMKNLKAQEHRLEKEGILPMRTVLKKRLMCILKGTDFQKDAVSSNTCKLH